MRQNLIEEVNRIKKIMGIIKESSVLSWIDELFKVATNNKIILNSFKNLEDRILPNNLDLIKQSIDEGINEGVKDSVILKNAIVKVAEKSNVSYDEALKSILKNQEGFDKILLDELVNIKIKNIIDDVEFSKSIDDIVKQKVDAKIKPVLDSQVKQSIDFLKKLDPDTLKTELEERIKKLNDSGLSDSVKNFWKNTYDILAKEKNIESLITVEVKNLVDDSVVTKRLANNRYSFRDKFKVLFRVILDKYGKNWESVLGEEIAREEKKIFDLLEELFPGKIWSFNPVVDGITKEGNISKLRELIVNYKIFGNVDGKYSPFNFFDTNRTQNTNFFLKAAEDLLSPEEFKKLKEGIVDNVDSEEVKGIFNKLFKKLEDFEDPKVKQIWDDVLINPESKYLLKTESKSMGDLGIKTFKGWINELGYKVIWSGVDGSPVDRILGIDAIIEINGVMYTVQVKTGVFQVYGRETIQVGEGEILEFYRVWSKTRKEFDSGGNVQYGSIVDKNGNIMMFGEQGKVSMTDGELKVDMSNVKITTLQAGGITKILDNKNGLTTYVRLGQKNKK